MAQQGNRNTPANRVDFDKLRKKRQRAQTIKRFVALGVILALIGGIIAFNRYLVEHSVTVQLGDFVESFGGSGYPIPVPGGVIRDVKSMDGDLVVLNDTSLYIYNKNGKTLTTQQRMNESTVMLTTAKRTLTYDYGGRRFLITSPSQLIVEKTYDYNLLGADINEKGDYVLVSTSTQYVAQVTVFNSKNEWFFEWLSADNVVTDVALSPRSTRLVASCINTAGGEAYSLLYLFDMGRQQEQERLEIPGEIALQVKYLENGQVSLLTDCALRVYSEDLRLQSTYAFEGRRLAGIERRGAHTLLQLEQKEGRGSEVILLDGECHAVSTLQLEKRARDMALADNGIYVLTEAGITAYNRDMAQVASLEMRGISDIHLVKNKLHYLNREEINVWEY